MATPGPKSGRCGGGQAGVLRCRVAGLAPSPLDRGSQEDNPALGDRCNPSGVQQRGPDPSDVLTLRLEEDLGGKQTPLPHQVSELGARGRRSEVEFQSRLRCVPAHSAARAPRWLRGKRPRLAGQGKLWVAAAGEPRAVGADTTPSAFGAGNNGTQLQ